MPYKKPYGYKRTYKRKPNMRSQFKKFGSRAGGAAHTALKIAMRLKDMVNTEFKFTLQQASQAYDYNGTLYSFPAAITQGLSDSQRIGDSIKMQTLTLKYYAQRNASTDTLIRIIVFVDKQGKITAPNQLLTAADVGTVYSVIANKNFDNRFESKFLLDQVITLNADNTTVKREHVIPVNLHSQFNAATTAINTGDLKMLVISNTTGAASPSLAFLSRLTYTDN